MNQERPVVVNVLVLVFRPEAKLFTQFLTWLGILLSLLSLLIGL